MDEIRKSLQDLVKQRAESQRAIARAAGISPQRFNDILQGRKPLSIKLIDPICRALGCEPNDLFGWEREPDILSGTIQKITVMERGQELEMAVITNEEIITADSNIVVKLTPSNDQCSLSRGGQGSLP